MQKFSSVFALLLITLLAASNAQQLRGVNYGVQRGDGSCSNYDQVLADFQIIKTFAQAVKIFTAGYCNGAQNVVKAAQATGLKVFLGVQAAPDNDYNNEKTVLRNVYNSLGFSNVLGITVGSEDLYRGSVSSDALASKILDVKAMMRGLGSQVPVTHTDVYYLQPQNILNADDIVMFNAFPYWEGQNVDNALNAMISHYNDVKSKAGGKTVWIGETGWPTAGATQGGNAVASSANMQKYLNAFICWANANGVPYFWFESFDEPWKGAGAESNWGLYTNERTKKAGFTLSCSGATSASTPATSSTKTSAPVTSAPKTSTSVKTSTSASSVKTSTSASSVKTSASSSQTPGTSATCTKGNCATGFCNCNGACFSPSTYTCTTDNNGAIVLCPVGTLSCNKACYDPSKYTCGPNGLQQKP